MINWYTIQHEVIAWALHNFGNQAAWQPMLGLVEEMGEFMAARSVVTAKEQLIDALGDQAIYVMNLCEIAGLRIGDIAKENATQPQDLSDAQVLGVLGAASHAVLKNAQGIRGYDESRMRKELHVALTLWYRWAIAQCVRHNTPPLLSVVSEIWNEVRHRDWVKNPTGAHRDAASQKQSKVQDDLAGGK